MTVPHWPKFPLVSETEKAWRGAAESRLLRRVEGSKMAAAEEDCPGVTEADQELEELLESKSL